MPGVRYVSRALLSERTAAWLSALEPWSRRRSIPELDRSALLVLDVQRYFAASDSHAYLPALEAVQPNILELVHRFRAAGRPVVFTRHGSNPGSVGCMQRWWRDDLTKAEPRARLVEELERIEPDLLLDKERYSAFCGTKLQSWLADRGCDTVVITGVMTHLCCESTARAAFMCDFAPVIVADACASSDEDLHLGALRGLAHGFAVVTRTAEISAALAGARTAAPPGVATDQTEGTRTDLVVVGAGPAGLAAATQARRCGLSVALLDVKKPGGWARTAECIENYLGFPGGISGQMLMDRFWAQAREHGLELLPARVFALEMGDKGFGLRLEGRSSGLLAPAVILATGTIPIRMDVDLRPILVDRVDEIPFVRGKQILVIGGGEAALDQALLAHRLRAGRVTVVVRGREPRAMERLKRRVSERGIVLLSETSVKEMVSAPSLAAPALVRLVQRGEDILLAADFAVACIGKRPCLPLLPEEIKRDSAGSPLVDELGRTSAPGLYLVGDVRRGHYRQVAIAVGDGVAAAMHVVHYLSRNTWRD